MEKYTNFIGLTILADHFNETSVDNSADVRDYAWKSTADDHAGSDRDSPKAVCRCTGGTAGIHIYILGMALI